MMLGSPFHIDPVQHGGACLRTFLNIADVWSLSPQEQMQMLGIEDPTAFDDLKLRVRAHEAAAIPINTIVRIGCVLSIYASLVTLVSHERSADWIHAPNNGSIFGGDSALALMTSGAVEDLDRVAQYLSDQVHG